MFEFAPYLCLIITSNYETIPTGSGQRPAATSPPFEITVEVTAKIPFSPHFCSFYLLQAWGGGEDVGP